MSDEEQKESSDDHTELCLATSEQLVNEFVNRHHSVVMVWLDEKNLVRNTIKSRSRLETLGLMFLIEGAANKIRSESFGV